MKLRFLSWRLVWLLPALLLFLGAADQVARHRAFLGRLARLGPPRVKVPPTMYSEHPSMAIALACMGAVFAALAFRRPPIRTG